RSSSQRSWNEAADGAMISASTATANAAVSSSSRADSPSGKRSRGKDNARVRPVIRPRSNRDGAMPPRPDLLLYPMRRGNESRDRAASVGRLGQQSGLAQQTQAQRQAQRQEGHAHQRPEELADDRRQAEVLAAGQQRVQP